MGFGLMLALAGVSWGYTFITSGGQPVKWNPGSVNFTIIADNSTSLFDGTTRATSIQQAMQLWNNRIAGVQFVPTIAPGASAGDGNGANEVIFSPNIFGDPFDDPSILAVTTTWAVGSKRVEADIVFNTAWSWDSYAGSLDGEVIDVMRIALHELGHALGLDHPDQATPPQSVTAIMNANASNLDRLQQDDISGGQSLYGGSGGVTAPGNDAFANATTITLSGNSAQATGSSVYSTKEAGEPHHAGEISGTSVWWRWTAPGSGSMTITTAGSNFDTLLGVYTGSSVSGLSTIASNDDTPGGGGTSAVTFNATSGTTYFIAVDGWDYDSGAVTLNLSFTPTVGNTAPSITSHPQNITVPVGQSGQFSVSATGTPAPSYQWQRLLAGDTIWANLANGGGLSGVTSPTITVNPVTGGMNGQQFRCVVTNSSGSVTSNPATLTVPSAAPVITGQDAGLAGSGEYATLNVYATGSPAPSFQWQRLPSGESVWANLSDSVIFSGTQQSRLLVLTMASMNGDQFRCVVSNTFGSVTSNPVPFTVGQDKTIGWVNVAFPSTGIQGAQVSGTARVVNTGPATLGSNDRLVLYRPGGIELGSASLNGLAPGQAATLTVTFTVPYELVSTAYNLQPVNTAAPFILTNRAFSFTVTAPATAPAIVTQPVSRQAFVGENVTFTAFAIGQLPLSYQWRFNGVDLAGQTSATLTLPNVQFSVAGNYTVRVTNSLGAATSDVATLTLQTPPGVVSAMAGSISSVFLRADGSRWVLGDGHSGEFGDGTINSYNLPVRLGTGVALIDGTLGDTGIFAKTDGTLWAAGMEAGTLAGLGTTQQLNPVPVINGTAVADLTPNHFFVKTDGTLWAAGLNGNGRLGDGTQTNRPTPVQVATDVGAVAAGTHAFQLKADGTVWGTGGLGALSPLNTGYVDQNANTSVPVLIAEDVSDIAAGGGMVVLLKTDGSAWAGGSMGPIAQLASNVVRVATSGSQVFVVKSDGSLWGMGTNDRGQLGDGTTTARSSMVQVATAVFDVSTSGLHTLFVKQDGSLWGMGDADHWQIGAQPNARSLVPVQLASGSAQLPSVPTGLAASDGALRGIVRLSWNFSTGASAYEIWRNSTNNEAGASRLATVFGRRIYFDRTAGSSPCYYWVKAVNPAGASGFSQPDSGYGLAATAPVFTTQPGNATFTLGTFSPTTFTAAANGDPAPRFRWQVLPAGESTWQDLDARTSDLAGTHTATLTIGSALAANSQGNKYRCVATNLAGNVISNEATLMVLVPPPVVIGAIARYTVAVGSGGKLFASYSSAAPPSFQWIKDGVEIPGATQDTFVLENLQLSGTGIYSVRVTNSGGSVTADRAILTVVPGIGVISSSINGSGRDSVFLRTDHTLWAINSSAFPRLVESPTLVAIDMAAAAEGDRFTMFLTANGTLWHAGRYFYPYTPPPSTIETSTPGSVQGVPIDYFTSAPIPIAAGVIAVAAGNNHAAFIKSDGTLWTVGNNSKGQLGNGSLTSRVDPVQIATGVVKVAAGADCTFFIKGDGSLWATGGNSMGILGDGTTTNRNQPVQIASGVSNVSGMGAHTIFLKLDGTMWGMGVNFAGELGQGVAAPVIQNSTFVSGQQTTPVQLASGVTQILAGPQITFFKKSDGTTWALGSGLYGRLGNGAEQNSNIPVQIPTADLDRSSVGPTHVFFVRADSSLWAAGLNGTGQLGDSTTTSTVVQKLITGGPTDPVAPIILVQPQSIGRTNGQSATFYVAATGSPLPSQRWQRLVAGGSWTDLSDGGPYSGSGTSTLTIGAATFAMNGDQFRSVASNSRGTATSSAATLTVIDPPAIPVRPSSRFFAAGEARTLTVTALNAATYTWRRNGLVISGATTNTLTLSSVTPADRGLYEVVADNVVGRIRTLFYVAVAGSNSVTTWGDNSLGQRNVPAGLANLAQVSSGVYHTLALKGDGTVVAWGDNAQGQCNVPAGLANVIAVSAGRFHSIALKGDGTVVAWGQNDSGQATVPAGLNNVVWVSAGGSHTMAMRNDGTLVSWGDNTYGQCNGPAGLEATVIGLSAGLSHTVAVKNGGTFAVWGRNDFGQANLPAILGDVATIDAGASHNVAIKSNGTVGAWGRNDSGQLVVPSGLMNVRQVDSLGNHTLALKADGTVVAWGSNAAGQCDVPAGLANVQQVAAGALHSIALVTVAPPPAVAVVGNFRRVLAPGESTVLEVTATGTGTLGYQWMRNGRPIAGANASTFALTGAGYQDSGYYFAKVTDTNGTTRSQTIFVLVAPAHSYLHTWGYVGQQQANFPANLTDLIAVSAGDEFAVGLKRDGTVVAWGRNILNSTTVPAGLTDVVALSTTDLHSLALKSDGTVVAWGSNTNSESTVPAGLAGVVAIAAGGQHNLALKSDGTIVAWGSASSGALTTPAGLADVIAIGARYHNLAVKSDGTVVAWGPATNTYGQLTVPAGLGNVVGVAAGNNHSVAYKADGTVVAWGATFSGQATVPGGLANVIRLAAGLDHNLAVRADGSLAGWGDNYSGYGGIVPPPSSLAGVFAVAAGSRSSIVLRDSTGDAIPTIVTPPATLTRAEFSSATFTVVANGTPLLNYQWRRNGVNIPGATGTTLTLLRLQLSDAGDYDVVVTNHVGSVTSPAATLNVLPVPVVTSLTPTRQALTPGQPLNLSVSATGTGTVTYQWTRNGHPIAGQTGSSFAKGAVGLADGGYYSVWITDDNGTRRSAPIFVNVAPAQTQVYVWGGDRFGSIMTPGLIPGGVNDVIAVANGDNRVYVLRRDGTVRTYPDNQSGMSAALAGWSDVVALCGGSNFVLAIKKDGTLLTYGGLALPVMPSGQAEFVAVSASGDHAMALRNDGSVLDLWPSSFSSLQTPVLTDAIGIAAVRDHSLALRGNGTVVTWGSGNDSYGMRDLAAGLSDITALSGGSLHALALRSDGTVIGAGYAAYSAVTPPADLTGVVEISAGAYHSIARKADGTLTIWGGYYIGQSQPPEPLANVVAVDANRTGGWLSSVALRDAAGDVAPAITSHPATQSLGAGQTITLQVEATGSFLGYRWRKNGQDVQLNNLNVSGGLGPTLTITNAQPGDSGAYDVVVTNSLGTAISNSATVTVGPPVFTSVPASRQVAMGGSTTLSATTSNATSYVWKRNGVVVPGATSSSLTITGASLRDRGIYEVTAGNAAGSMRSLVYVNVAAPNTLTAWGDNSFGQTTMAGGLSNLTQVSSGVYHNLALRANGTVAAWGDNTYGQSTVPFTAANGGIVQISAGRFHSVALRLDGGVTAWGLNDLGQINVPAGLSNVIYLSAGGSHTVALRSDGTLVAWGDNTYGQCNVPAGLSNSVIGMAAGNQFTLAVRNDGTVVAWGRNDFGQTNIPAGLSNVVAVEAGAAHSLAIKADGSVVAWGRNDSGQTAPPAGLSNVLQADSLGNHTVAVKTDGLVVAWGSNANGQAAVPAGLANVQQVAAGALHSLALVGPIPPTITRQPANTAVMTGQVAAFTLQASGLQLSYQWQVQAAGDTAWTDVADGSGAYQGAQTAALTQTNATLSLTGYAYRCIVSNAAGTVTSQSAVLTVTPAPVPPAVSARPASQLAPLGGNVTLAITATGATSYIWRRNGVVIPGATTNTLTIASATVADRGLYEIVAHNADGDTRSLVYLNVTGSNAIAAWGDNTLGQMAVPAGLVNLAQISSGVYHTLALKGDGTVVAWGDNALGQCNVPAGLTNVVAVSAGRFHSVALKADGTVVAWGQNDLGQAGVPAGLAGVVWISAGGAHTVGLKNDGTIVSWGDNTFSQRVAPAGLSATITNISAGMSHTLALKNDGTVVAWGRNDFGQLNIPAGLANVMGIDAGASHNVAIKADGTVVTWGRNDSGQTAVPAGLTGVRQVDSLGNHTLAVKTDGSIAAWGSNAAGQCTVPAGLGSVQQVAAGALHSVVLITVVPPVPPSITSHPANVTAAFGDTPTFSVTATGNALTYKWQQFDPYNPAWADIAVDNFRYSGANTATLQVVVTTSVTTTTQYRCIVSNGGGTATSNAATLTLVFPPPILDTVPGPQTLIVGSRLELTISASSIGSLPAYQWQKDGVDIPGATTTTFVIPAVQLSDSGSYRMVATNAVGPATSTAITVTVLPVAGGISGAAAYSHTLVVRSDGTLWAAGYGAYFGDVNGTLSSLAFVMDHVVQTSAAYLHSLVLRDDGDVWYAGEVLPPAEGNYADPIKIGTGAVAVSSGMHSGYFIKKDGTLWAVGNNSSGQLGDGSTTFRTTPVQVASNVVDVAGGSYRMFFLKADGALWAVGSNQGGALGDGTFTNRPTPVQVASGVVRVFSNPMADTAVFLKSDGTLWGMGYLPSRVRDPGPLEPPGGVIAEPSPTPIQVATNVREAAVGGSHILFIKSDGTLWAAGSNNFGQLGDGTFTERRSPVQITTGALSVAAGVTHSLFVKTDGSVWTMGSGNWTLIDGSTITGPSAAPVRILSGPLVVPAVPTGLQGSLSATPASVRLAWNQVVGAKSYEVWRSTTNDSTTAVRIAAGLPLPLFFDGTGAPGTSYYYWVKAVNPAGASGFGSSLNVVFSIAAPPTMSSRPLSQEVAVGGSASITVPAQHATGFQWKRNGTLIAGATTNTLSIANATLADRGLYEVVASNDYGSVRALFHLNVAGTNTVTTWGDNGLGQRNVPAGVANLAQISSGVYHTLALKNDGTVVAWGDNTVGQCNVPGGLTNVVAVSAGRSHSVALKGDGTVVAWGLNDFGQSSVPGGLGGVVWISAGGAHTMALKNDGTIVSWGDNTYGQRSAPAGLDATVINLSAGLSHTLALKNDGTVVAWGRNDFGQTTIPAGLTGVVGLDAGASHNVAIKSDGTVVAWGRNDSNQTVVPAGLTNAQQVDSLGNHTLALKADGSVVAWGNNSTGQTTVPAGLTAIQQVTAGALHSVALVIVAPPLPPSITNSPSNATVTAGQDASFNVTATGAGLRYQWRKGGNNLANGGRVSGASSATLTITATQAGDAGNYDVVVSNVSGSATSSAASLTVNPAPVLPTFQSYPGSLVLGLGTGANLNVSATNATGYVWKHNGAVIAGATTASLDIITATLADRGLYEVIATNANGSVRTLFFLNVAGPNTVTTWGDNGLGQRNVPAGLANLAQVSAGVYHTLALKGDGTVAAWGDNTFGQINVPAGLTNVVAVSAGRSHSVALKSDGTVVAWGLNDLGQASVPGGLSNVVWISAGGAHTMAIKNDGSIVSWGDNTYGQRNPPAGLDATIVGLTAGLSHTVALKNDGTVVAWGRNDFGQTTIPAGLTGVAAIEAGASHNLAIKSDGTVVAWGRNDSSQTAVPAGLTGVRQVDSLGNHTVAVKTDGTVVAWGNNSAAQSTVPSLANVQMVTAGALHSVALVAAAAPTPPSITNSPSNVTVTTGQNANFNVTASGTGLSYQWRKGGNPLTNTGNISGVATATLTITAAQPGDAGSYDVVVSNSAGSATSGAATLTVNTPPPVPVLTARPASSVVTAGGNISLSVSATAATSYAWKRNGVLIPSATTDTLNITNATLADRGLYEVTVTNAAGSVRSLVYLNTAGINVVRAWGDNSFGQRNVPAGVENLAQVSSGVYHNLALKGDGTVAAWGDNALGQCNVPAGLDNVVLVSAGRFHSVALKGDGTVVAWGDNGAGQCNVTAGLSNVVWISAGGAHTLALKNDGTIVSWGDNTYGQRNAPAGLDATVVGLAAGLSHTAALKNDGTVVAWGRNDFGQTTIPSGLSGVVAIEAGASHNLAIKADGTVVAWGRNDSSQTAVPAGLTGVRQVESLGNHTVALRTDGTVAAWGNNSAGQATIPGDVLNAQQVSAGALHSVALISALPVILVQPDDLTEVIGHTAYFDVLAVGATSYQWRKDGVNLVNGGNISGATTAELTITSAQAGDAGDYDVVVSNAAGGVTSEVSTLTMQVAPEPPAFPVRPLSRLISDATGMSLTVDTTGPGQMLYTWKRNGIPIGSGVNAGVLNLMPTLPLRDRGLYEIVVTTAYGSVRTLFHVNVAGTNQVTSWGDNSFGQRTVPAGVANLAQISTGVYHNLALKADGTVAAWGDNSAGQCNVPIGMSNVVAVSAGRFHSVALKGDGSVVAWGDNAGGQCNVPGGLSNVVWISAGGAHTVAVKNDGTVVAWGDNTYGQCNVPAGLSSTVIGLAAGQYHTVALKNDGVVVAWGRNDLGQTTIPAGLTGVVGIEAGASHNVAIKLDGTVVAWGRNESGQTVVPAGLATVRQVESLGNHTLAVKADGSVAAWGANGNGQAAVPAGLANVQQVAAGALHSVALVGNDSAGTGSAPSSGGGSTSPQPIDPTVVIRSSVTTNRAGPGGG